MPEAYIVDAARTPTGRRRGGLAHVHGADLGAHIIKALVGRNPIPDVDYDDVMFGCVDDGKTRKQTFHVQSHVGFCRCLASSMFGPVHAIGNQFNGGGINDVDPPFETCEAARHFATGILRKCSLQMVSDVPKQSFRQLGRSSLVGIGKSVATGRFGTADLGERN